MGHVRRMSLAVVALIAALIAVTGQASAASQVPFRAALTNANATVPCPPNTPVPSFCVAITGSGHATHMGEIQESGFVVVSVGRPCGPGCVTDFARHTITAANGDQIVVETTGENSATADPTIRFRTGPYVVTGGTGRFSGASGSGTATATINMATGTSTATFVGVQSTPGSRQ